MEQQIKLAAKLYQCRDTAKQIYGDRYREVLKPFTSRIRNRMDLDKCDELMAVLAICKGIKDIPDSGTATMLYMAAAVEMIEPTEAPKAQPGSKEGER